MISASEALSTILRTVRPLDPVTVHVERALHLALGSPVVAQSDVPPFDNAQMDGFAVRSADVQSAPAGLRLSGEIAAGDVAKVPLEAGTAMRIMTGAKIPAGCDAVVQLEWAREEGGGSVTIGRTVSAGHNIRRAGADIRSGSTIFTKGRRLRPQEIGVLASLGIEFVTVVRRPGVAILPTGNEVTELGKPLIEGRIRNSSTYSLTSLVRELGCEPVRCEIARDDRADLLEKARKGLREDILVTTGGVSVGKYDLVRDVLLELGVEIVFWKVNIKPGMPFLFGMHGKTPVFGLPGNTVSTMVTFLQFVRPAIEAMMGFTERQRSIRKAKLAHEFSKTDGKRHYLRGILDETNGEATVRTTGSQISNVLSSLTLANCLIVIPEDTTLVRAGEEVEIELL